MSEAGTAETEQFRLWVYRPSPSTSDFELAKREHKQRAQILEAVVKEQPAIRGVEWGQTNSDVPHEVVEIIILGWIAAQAIAPVAGSAAAVLLATPAFVTLGTLLSTHVVPELAKTGVVKGVKWFLARIGSSQQKKELDTAGATLPDGIRVQCTCSSEAPVILVKLPNKQFFRVRPDGGTENITAKMVSAGGIVSWTNYDPARSKFVENL